MGHEDSARIEDALFAGAQRQPGATAVLDGTQTASYRDLANRVLRLADRLVSAGVEPGQRVVIYLDKTLDSVVALYAAWAAGAVAVPANEGLRSRQVQHIVTDSEATLVISEARKLSRLDGDALAGRPLLALERGEAPEGDPEPGPAVARQPELRGGPTAAAILYTSGSTGLPKGILISHANLVAGSRIVSGYLQLASSDRIISVLPFSFDYGLNQLLTSVRQGATLVLQRSHFSPDICRTLIEQQITVMAAVPPLWIQLQERHSPFPRMAFPRLRVLTNSGGVFPVELVARYRAQLPKARLYLMYGLSEAFRSTYLPPELVDVKTASMGKAIPETDILVLAEDGSIAADDQPGELVHRGPTVALGYWRNPEATALRFRPDPFPLDSNQGSGQLVVYSGDVVRRDRDGFLYFLGRRDQQIKTQGFRVSPEEVEQIIYASGLASEAAVCAQPDAVAGSALVAHVVPRNPGAFTQEAFMAFCRREMPSYMIPKAVLIHESLPRTASGKLDRGAVAR